MKCESMTADAMGCVSLNTHARAEVIEIMRHMRRVFMVPAAMAALTLGAAVPASWAATVELDEAFVRIEINATDGDVGFHGKFDGEPSKLMKIKRPGDGSVIYLVRAQHNLKRQGLTENFFESAEPTCEEQPLAAFLLRFPAGEYLFEGVTNDGVDRLEGVATLSHALPAAPDISGFDGSTVELDDDPIVIHWAPGADLGECHDQELVDNGTIPDPASVAVERWEVVVEPNVDDEVLKDLGLPFSVFSVQLPPGQMSVTVPFEYLHSYAVADVTDFKFEVGAKSGENQTFSEGTFTVELDD